MHPEIQSTYFQGYRPPKSVPTDTPDLHDCVNFIVLEQQTDAAVRDEGGRGEMSRSRGTPTGDKYL